MPDYNAVILHAITTDGKVIYEKNPLCRVDLTDGKITVGYRDDENDPKSAWNVYEGTEHGDGHYELARTDGRGSSNLHRWEKGLVGWWEEDRKKGFWRIELRL